MLEASWQASTFELELGRGSGGANYGTKEEFSSPKQVRGKVILEKGVFERF